MTHFNESKLSRIIARRIIAPKDRSQMLPLCTPIYCPNYNGVRASRVTVINPNTNSFNVDTTGDTTSIGVTQSKVAAALNPLVDKNGSLSINEKTGVASEFSSTNYLSIETPYAVDIQKIHIAGTIPAGITNPVNIVGVTSNTVETLTVQPNGNVVLTKGSTTVATLGKAQFDTEFHMDLVLSTGQINVTIKHLLEGNEDVMETFINDGTVTLLSFGASSDASYSMDLNHAYFMIDDVTKVPFFNDGRQVTNPRTVSNTFDVVMNLNCTHTYFLPHEVDLETDVNMVDMIKSDFAVRFKEAVSSAILGEIATAKASIPKITKGTDLATTIGTIISDNILNGTGQRYSIYKYDNGAPVSTLISSNQPNIDDLVLDDEKPDGLLSEVPMNAYKREYAVKDDVDVPAMFFIEKPTLILNPTDFTTYQVGLCNGDIKTYVPDTIKVDTTKVDFSDIGLSIFGSNDTFAVAFTEAKTSIQPDKEFYANNITITVNFGVKLVHTNNLRLVISGT